MASPSHMPDDLPPISIVVIGRNEGERLIRCLKSVQAVDYPAELLELIYVDTHSSDGSAEAAERLGARVIRINPRHPTAAAARNAGLHVARHELVQFLDGDTILNAGWLKAGVAALADTQVVCVFGRVEELAPHASIYNFWAHHDWYVPAGPVDYCGGIALFRTHVVRAVNGFDESLIAGEENNLANRLRQHDDFRLLSLPEAMVLHDINMTRWRQYWKRCVRTGHAYAEGQRRRTECRNIFYALATPIALGLSIATWSSWPLLGWFGFLGLAITRNALRSLHRIGTIQGSLLYSVHHYICKTPMAMGQCAYWLRHMLGLRPQPLIEYRS